MRTQRAEYVCRSLEDLLFGPGFDSPHLHYSALATTDEGFLVSRPSMKQSILIVDDEQDIIELLKYNLEKEGFQVLSATNGREALVLAGRRPDLIILDVMLPEMDGWEVCRTLRQNSQTAEIPVIFLTARENETDEVVGLELGAADYVTKPVRIRTLLARVKKALRSKDLRIQGPGEKSTIRVGSMEIIPESYVVRLDGKEVHFPKKEFEVLLFLARRPGRVITREILLNEVWGQDVFVVDRTVDVHVRKIREKLKDFAFLIETVKGVGYRFKKDL